MKLYGIPNCNTVKKARAWLETHHVDYDFHDFKKQGVSQAMLDKWLAQQPWEKLLNRAGMTWRQLDDDRKHRVVDNGSAARLMMDKPTVIKRPVLEKDGKILALGFNQETYQALFK